MKRNLALDELTYDLTLDGYNLKLTSTVAELVSQKLENKLRTLKGEFFANEKIGLPYFQIVGKSLDVSYISTLVKNTILSVEEIESITGFSVDLDGKTRVFSIVFSAKLFDGTDTGEISLEV